jgi:N-carbamoylputrescine amidase
MTTTVKAALLQTDWAGTQEAMTDKHEEAARDAAAQGAQVMCFQELFYGPYFCQVQDPQYYSYTEKIPDGPTTKRMQDLARQTGMALVVPMYEEDEKAAGIYYNTAAVIDSDGKYLGKYRKTHIPHVKGFWEKFYFRPGNLGYPVFETAVGKVGVYICYDRHFPEGARALGLNGAEIVLIPSATSRGLSEYLWRIGRKLFGRNFRLPKIPDIALRSLKYILLGHGHGDHFAGAAYFQEQYGTKVGTTAADWDLIHPPNPPADKGKQSDNRPNRDLVLKEGTPITLGGETVNIVEIPGHTPGAVAFIFNVKENGRTHTAGLFGGTILGQANITTEGLNQYLRSIDHYLEFAKKMKVDVEIQNHALFDDTEGRIAKFKTRKPGDPNPLLMPIDKYTRMWGVVSECIQAEIARRPSN